MIENVNYPNQDHLPILWPVLRQYPKLRIPETWDTIEEFVDWYVAAGKPIIPPWDAFTVRTDDATAMAIFRKGVYQVELYIIHPGYNIPVHAHPNMEVITMTMGGGTVCGERRPMFGTSQNYGRTSKIVPGEWHGGKPTEGGTGFMILSFEKFLNGTMPTSAALQWEGPTAGPIHDRLLGTYAEKLQDAKDAAAVAAAADAAVKDATIFAATQGA